MAMNTTANPFSIKMNSGWGGTEFVVMDANNVALFRAGTIELARLALALMQEPDMPFAVIDNRIRLKPIQYSIINSLVTKYRASKPLRREELGGSEIQLGESIALSFSSGVADINGKITPLRNFRTLEEIFMQATNPENLS